jgi:large subunit ribosomal protein L10
LPTAEKQQTIKELAGLMKKSAMMVLTDYRGMTVADISDLRRQMRAKGMEYHVTKNTLTVLAAQEAGIAMTTELRDLLNGPTAIAFVADDIAAGSKMLNDYLRTARVLKVKAALLEGQVLKADALGDIAKLPGRQQLLASILGGVQAPLNNLASTLNNLISGLATALQQQVDKQTGGDNATPETAA